MRFPGLPVDLREDRALAGMVGNSCKWHNFAHLAEWLTGEAQLRSAWLAAHWGRENGTGVAPVVPPGGWWLQPPGLVSATTHAILPASEPAPTRGELGSFATCLFSFFWVS